MDIFEKDDYIFLNIFLNILDILKLLIYFCVTLIFIFN